MKRIICIRSLTHTRNTFAIQTHRTPHSTKPNESFDIHFSGLKLMDWGKHTTISIYSIPHRECTHGIGRCVASFCRFAFLFLHSASASVCLCCHNNVCEEIEWFMDFGILIWAIGEERGQCQVLPVPLVVAAVVVINLSSFQLINNRCCFRFAESAR